MRELKKILLQADLPFSRSREALACRNYNMLRDVPLTRVPYADLAGNLELIRNSEVLVVGTVEFVKKALHLKGLAESDIEFNTYPDCFLPFFVQKPVATTLAQINWEKDDLFLKPRKIKQFTGFCLKDTAEHATIEKSIAKGLPEKTPVWASSRINLLQEWRVYVKNNKILAAERYDESEDEDEDPKNFAANVLSNSDIIIPFSLDVGLLASKQWTIVECNDAWALGLYGKSLSAVDYVEFLWERWRYF